MMRTSACIGGLLRPFAKSRGIRSPGADNSVKQGANLRKVGSIGSVHARELRTFFKHPNGYTRCCTPLENALEDDEQRRVDARLSACCGVHLRKKRAQIFEKSGVIL
ncbi:hypothetical protein K443DRAFT_381752 [Laccaria amethystina LaAM-08-1]|uniref:Uncharacterized protein n=1 Tax=Laccaria amethystina LaAM-08-1 TaxID=1095629 RepID=A0A0C9WXP4_9AGAR|nr:hypothetical protein K443DRAFT_381752 [Laccaria amethystina LaAM-08-1]